MTSILPLDATEAPLALVGGKGASLARLVRSGFAVPGGFVVPTTTYRQYLQSNGLGDWILQTAEPASADDAGALEGISAAIRMRFTVATLPSACADDILERYVAFGSLPVAVRSSATTEDLPELSFAGQHDTFLNVQGGAALLAAVVRCWSSLWTARAIGYRVRNEVPHREAALAVVVQAMVQSDVAGVLFTANPMTGKRTETVIDAALGLGESLVSGQVSPDHYVVDNRDGRILQKSIGSKAVRIDGRPNGGTLTRAAENADQHQALPDAVIGQLAGLGRQIERLFGSPQDIEWAWAEGELFVLQSRPITTLFPLPEGCAPDPGQVLISFGAIQGMLDPLTPFGRDLFRNGAALAGDFLGSPATLDTQDVFQIAGERVFLNVTGAVRNAHTRPVIRQALGMVEPGIGAALACVLEDPRFAPNQRHFAFRVWLRLSPFLLRILANLTFNLLWPDAGRVRIQRRIERAVEAFQARADAARTLSERVDLCESMIGSLRDFGPVVMPGLAAGLGSLRCLHWLVSELPEGKSRAMDLTRGLAHNVTTEMDLALWQAALAIKADATGAARIREANAAGLADDWKAKALPPSAQKALDDFLRRFGMRGVAEIDLGRARWREEPKMLIQTVQSYLRIDDAERAPDAVFRRGAASAGLAVEGLAEAIRTTRLGWLRSAFVRWLARRVRALAGLRESPKFTVIRLFGILRESLLASGRELESSGLAARAEDVFFLPLEEVRRLAHGEPGDWRALVARQREAYEREKRRRQIPRLMLSDGQAFFESADKVADGIDEAISGTPVSAGIAEGIAHVVLDPHEAQLSPGEILVCPGTDPAWTPLFLAAGGLVMEVGGLMTHGSVVAREYGIPAVVGVHRATTRLRSGQRIRVDGSRGTILVLEGS